MSERDRILELLRRHGWNATSFQALEPGFRYWFAGEDAAVAYVETSGAYVVAGPPIAPEEKLAEVAAAFVTHARACGRRVCFFAVEERLLRAIRMRSLQIGLQPRWDPRQWVDRHRGHRSLKEQLRRARAKGIVVERLSTDDVAQARPRIEELIGRWLSARKLPPMAFLVELSPFIFAEERRYYAARRTGALQGLLVAVPVFRRSGWFFEDILRDPGAPNGTSEALVDAAMRDAAEDESEFVTLGLAPLAGDARWQLITRRGMEGFYNFEGLRAFKSKLRPDAWDPIYLAWPEGTPVPLAIFDALDAFAGGHLVRFAVRSLFRGPSVALFVLGVLAVPWAVLLATRDERWFPSRVVQFGWVAFDLGMAALLIHLSRRWRRTLGRAAAVAAAMDAVVTLVEAATYNVPRARTWRDWAGIVVAVTAPFVVTAVLVGALRNRGSR